MRASTLPTERGNRLNTGWNAIRHAMERDGCCIATYCHIRSCKGWNAMERDVRHLSRVRLPAFSYVCNKGKEGNEKGMEEMRGVNGSIQWDGSRSIAFQRRGGHWHV